MLPRARSSRARSRARLPRARTPRDVSSSNEASPPRSPRGRGRAVSPRTPRTPRTRTLRGVLERRVLVLPLCFFCRLMPWLRRYFHCARRERPGLRDITIITLRSPAVVRWALAKLFVLIPTLEIQNLRSHTLLPCFDHTRYLLLKCDYFHIENVLQALFVSSFLVNLLERNALQSHETVLKQKLANKLSHYWNVLPRQRFHTRSHIKNLNVNILRRTLLQELTN